MIKHIGYDEVVIAVYTNYEHFYQYKDILCEAGWNNYYYDNENENDSILIFSKDFIFNNHKMFLRVLIYNDLIPATEIADIVITDQTIPNWVNNRYIIWATDYKVIYTNTHSDSFKIVAEHFPEYALLICDQYNNFSNKEN